LNLSKKKTHTTGGKTLLEDNEEKGPFRLAIGAAVKKSTTFQDWRVKKRKGRESVLGKKGEENRRNKRGGKVRLQLGDGTCHHSYEREQGGGLCSQGKRGKGLLGGDGNIGSRNWGEGEPGGRIGGFPGGDVLN